MRAAALGVTPFAVVDLESTGIYPGGHDRIIEIAIVRMTPQLTVEDEWATLVDPRRDIGRTDIHGIRAADVIGAPVFEEIIGDVAQRLDGAIIVGHHLRFDLGFLTAEFNRCRLHSLPELPALCTLKLAYQVLPDAPSRKLELCCEEVGILHEDTHTALGDARATSQLLAVLIERAQRRTQVQLAELGCEPLHFPAEGWLAGLGPSGKRLTRDGAAAKVKQERSYLARLVASMLGDEATGPTAAEYLALVDRALEDRRVTSDEAHQLVAMAEGWGLTRADVLEAHRAYLTSLASEALVDGHLTAAERQDLEAVCDLLGLHQAALDVLLTPVARPRQRADSAARTAAAGLSHDLRGQSVCFTGEFLGIWHGERITREIAEKLAADAGLEVRSAVTKALDLLVVADPDTQSGKASKARQYGTRIMAEQAFWKALGLPVQ